MRRPFALHLFPFTLNYKTLHLNHAFKYPDDKIFTKSACYSSMYRFNKRYVWL